MLKVISNKADDFSFPLTTFSGATTFGHAIATGNQLSVHCLRCGKEGHMNSYTVLYPIQIAVTPHCNYTVIMLSCGGHGRCETFLAKCAIPHDRFYLP